MHFKIDVDKHKIPNCTHTVPKLKGIRNISKQNVLYNLIMENWTRDPFYLFICSWGELNPT